MVGGLYYKVVEEWVEVVFLGFLFVKFIFCFVFLGRCVFGFLGDLSFRILFREVVECFVKRSCY